jgi:hypothetical protein
MFLTASVSFNQIKSDHAKFLAEPRECRQLHMMHNDTGDVIKLSSCNMSILGAAANDPALISAAAAFICLTHAVDSVRMSGCSATDIANI